MNKNFSIKEIKNMVDEKVISQELAKQILIASFKEQQIRVNAIKNKKEINKFLTYTPNCILKGPEGCGKTTLVNTLLDIFDIPYIKINAKNPLSQNDLQSLFKELYDKSNKNQEVAEHGILFIENIDYLINTDNSLLLQLLDAGGLVFNETKYTKIKFKINNLLIIGEGNFNEKVKNQQNYDLLNLHFQNKISFEELKLVDLLDILVKTENTDLQHYINELEKFNIKLDFENGVLYKLAENCKDSNGNYNAKLLNQEILTLISRLQFYLLDYDNPISCTITDGFINLNEEPIIKTK